MFEKIRYIFSYKKAPVFTGEQTISSVPTTSWRTSSLLNWPRGRSIVVELVAIRNLEADYPI